jgi:lambda family phage portal protein
MTGVSWAPVRVLAEDMLHIYEILEPGQVRGLSAFASVLLRLSTLDKAEDAQLVRQMVAAMLMGFVVDPNGDGAGVAGAQTGSVLVGGLEPGTLKTLSAGQDIKFSEPANVGDGADFLKGQLRGIATGLGLTYEQLTGDLSGVNYSSIRAGLIEHRRRVDALRGGVLIPQLCVPVWQRFVRLQVLLGEIPAADYDRAPDTWESVEWFPPAWPWVDPLKDVEAEKAAVDAGFKSRAQVINERGEDPDAVDTMRAADRDREGRLGLSGLGAAPTPSEPTASEKDADDE